MDRSLLKGKWMRFARASSSGRGLHPAAIVRRVPPPAQHVDDDLRATEPMLDASRSGARPTLAARGYEGTAAPTRSGEYARAPIPAPSSTPPPSFAPPPSFTPPPSMSPRSHPSMSPPSFAPPPSMSPTSHPSTSPASPAAPAKPTKSRARPERTSWASIAFVVLSVLSLVGALGFGWTTIVSRNALLVDNAYDVPVSVRAGATSVTIPAHSTATIRLGGGNHTLTAEGPDGPERYVLALPDPRFGARARTALFNVGGKGRLAVVGVSYGAARRKPEPQGLDAARVIILPEVPEGRYGDLIDAPFPRELRVRAGGGGALMHVCHVAPDGRSGCALD